MARLASLIAVVVACPILTTAAAARADRGEVTEQTPYTLNPGEVRLGVSDAAIGLFGHELLRRMEIGTRPIAWVPSIGGLPSYDVHAKFELWRDRHLSLAVAAEHLAVDLSSLIESEGAEGEMAAPRELAFRVTPLEGWAGVRLSSWLRVNAGAIYTKVSLRGATAAGPIDELGGAVGSSSLQVRGNVQVRLSRSVHVVLDGRYTPWQEQWAEAGGSEEVGDGGEVSNTTRGEADLMNVGGRAWSVGAELHLAFEHTNLRLGVEYGNYSLPIVNFVISERGFMPVADLYWRL